MVIAVGNCGLYTGPWGVRVEDTVVVDIDGPKVLTDYPRQLEGPIGERIYETAKNSAEGHYPDSQGAAAHKE